MGERREEGEGAGCIVEGGSLADQFKAREGMPLKPRVDEPNPTLEFREMVHHPRHYNMGKIEVIDAIEDWGLGFNLGNAVKYIARAPHKEQPTADLEKAAWYLLRELLVKHGADPDKIIAIVSTIKRVK